MWQKILLLFNTLKYLKSKQIYYRLYYFLRKRIRNATGFEYPHNLNYTLTSHLTLQDSIDFPNKFENYTFTFLNLSHKYNDSIDWNYSEYGKLWTYNLNYFEFLNQKDFCADDGLSLINAFINDINGNREGLEPFPISLRVINWIKFLTYNQKSIHPGNDLNKIDSSLFAQLQILVDNIEYHLLGNHLLENGFALLFGAYYFEDKMLYQKAREILMCELDEQILDDGAHFELSLMYHQIMFFRVLDCINLVQNNNQFKKELLDVLEQKALIMRSWLNNMTFHDGSIPLLNDSANGIAPTTKELNHYAGTLSIKPLTGISLSSSGYRKFSNDKYEIVVDVGCIGPDYLPGHAHSDTFSYELYLNGKPFVVDTGISTYEANQQRLSERCTKAHNTVQIEGYEQSEVWRSFRVAQRAYVINIKEKNDKISAIHTGYEKIGCTHKREFSFDENCIVIKDVVDSKSSFNCFSYLHFHPDVKLVLKGNKIFVNGKEIIFQNLNKVTIGDYQYAPEFNKVMDAKMIIVGFENYLTTIINL